MLRLKTMSEELRAAGAILFDRPNEAVSPAGAGTVKFNLLLSDRASAPLYTDDFKESGTQTGTTVWTLGEASACPENEMNDPNDKSVNRRLQAPNL